MKAGKENKGQCNLRKRFRSSQNLFRDFSRPDKRLKYDFFLKIHRTAKNTRKVIFQIKCYAWNDN